MILCIAGFPGSGKTQISNYLKSKGFFTISFGSFIKEELSKHNIAYTAPNVVSVSLYFHRTGKDIQLAQKVLSVLHGSGCVNQVIDGCRNRREYEYIKEHELSDVYLVGVDCSKKVRYERAKKRRRFVGLTENDYKERDKREKNYGLNELLNSAEFRINNNGTKDELKSQVGKLLGKLNDKVKRYKNDG